MARQSLERAERLAEQHNRSQDKAERLLEQLEAERAKARALYGQAMAALPDGCTMNHDPATRHIEVRVL